ncbi:hypothetical protein ABID82_000634 [Methylobacterium sp. PvP062]|jgi:hypothetical protein|uniref:Uncharacterized protein n=2 Tax=Methylobacterium TaxID=407 RepID=A0ABV2NI52_9HYPH|nr:MULTISPECIES: hypothetical protein [Methylobacterium]MCX7333944.1 hypothetical protein [Hyphomicrobiales bacterium]GAN50232.1 hypothetical protein ME121_4271 [Methylobacterium sp. ME121]KIU30527.1 hypothetical protein SR39_20815 [Methylobacterium radiotolerans]KZC03177.1 hypothetical protein AU375_00616 [Methylobacterium radiotolerans]MBN6820105.1 hypothetical protein [Methylobacterium organophilum]
MAYVHGSRPNRRLAASLLEHLKGRLVDASEAVETTMTMQAATASPHWRLSNVAGVHVYEADGGWNADLVFENLPLGVPVVTGNAVPCATRRAALESAIRQLSVCAEREKHYLASFDTAMRWFVFDEVEVPVDPDYLPGVAARLADDGFTVEQACRQLARLRRIISGDGPVTADKVAAASAKDRESLAVACEVAMALGRTQFSFVDVAWADYEAEAPVPMH